MKKLGIYVIGLLFISTAYSQEIKKLTLEEAFDLATSTSKQIKLEQLKLKNIDFKKAQTKYAMLPIIGVSSSYTRLSNNIPDFEFGAFSIPQILNQYNNRAYIQQPIFQGLKNWNNLKGLDLQKKAANFDIQKISDDTKWNIVQAYYNLYKLQQTNNLLDSNIAQTQVRIDDLTKFKNAGLALNNDVMRAELQKTNLLVTKADIESSIETANFNLNIYLGLDGTTKFEIDNPTSILVENDSVPQLITAAYSNRPELKAQELRIKSADYSIKASKSSYMPTINFLGNGNYNNPNQRMFPPEAKFKATWDVGISLNWNLTNLYTTHTVVNDARNQKEQLKLTTEQIKEGIQMETNANYQAVKVAKLKIDLAQRSIEQATENKRILNNRFVAQIAILNDVLEADVLLYQAETNLLNAKADAAIAYYKLQKSLGVIK